MHWPSEHIGVLPLPTRGLQVADKLFYSVGF
ncbi:hypothetical protein IAE37_002417 [Pseudomonas sp. S31]|nr:hypothetical protein [Pseudomonas sp. S31]